MSGEAARARGGLHSRSSNEDNRGEWYPDHAVTGYGAAASEGVLRKVADTCLGRRQTLAHAAIRFGELLATGDLRDHDKVERLLVHAGVGLGKTEDDVRRIVAWGMRKGFVDGPPARDRQRVRSRNDAIALVFDQMELASQADWSGRTGATRYRVLVAFHLKAILHGRVEFYASLDHLAELAGVGRSTVHRHMPTFEGSWLRTVEVGSRRDGIATTYRVVRRTTVQSWDTGSPSGGAKGCVPGVHTPAVPVPHHPIMRPDHPVWRGYSRRSAST